MRSLLVLSVAFLLPVSATAANQPHPTLDAIASEVAGRPVSVWCETDEAEWRALTGGRTDLSGFVRSTSASVAYIAPRRCQEVTVGLTGNATAFDLGRGVLTLLHESVHLRGVHSEGETDCTALGLVKTYAIRYFGFKEQATVTRYVKRMVKVKRRVWVKRHGKRVRVAKWVRVRRTVAVRVLVPNPALENLYAVALQAHQEKASASPDFAGFCDR